MSRSLGLYIHIPFCVRKCEYCDFLSQAGTQQLHNRYCERLFEEIAGMSAGAAGYVVDTIFIGGGTPSILEPESIEQLMACIRQNFKLCAHQEEGREPLPDCLHKQDNRIPAGGELSQKVDTGGLEVTIECNPGTLDEEKLRAYRRAGINRISLGLQSADNEELRCLGRIHTWEQFLESALLVKKYFLNWNVDLMSALPGQSVDSWRRTLERTLALNPPHISAYSLILEEGTPFYKRYIQDERIRSRGEKPQFLPDEEEERAMYQLTGSLLGQYGYERYEISNYAKPGYACQHNNRYWLRKDYLGLGLGASSCMNDIRFKNTSDLTIYLHAAGALHKEELQRLTETEQMEETMYLGLRRMQGVDTEWFAERFGKTVQEVFDAPLQFLKRQQLIEYSGKYIQLTQLGIDVSNYALAQFLL